MCDIEALRRLREKFDFGTVQERSKFAKQFESLYLSGTAHLSISNRTSKDVDTGGLLTEAHRKSQVHAFNLIFKKEEIDRLLADTVFGRNKFLSLALKAGYKDEPDLDSDGKPVTLRTTALHYAARLDRRDIQLIVNEGSMFIRNLFKVYNKYSVNYHDKSGLTHLHVASLFRCHDVVKIFLDRGADPNCRTKVMGYTSLHLAMQLRNDDVVRRLLEYGANPNLADRRGRNALHSICYLRGDDWFLALMLLVLSSDEFRPLQLDARDKKGNTPLNLAMESENGLVVRVLLKYGADRTLTDQAEGVMSRELAKLARLPYDSTE